MVSINRKSEIEEMLAGFKWQATYSFRRIKRSLASEDRSLDEAFQKSFMRISNEILASSYLKVQKETLCEDGFSFDIDQYISTLSDLMLTNDTERPDEVFEILDSEDEDNTVQIVIKTELGEIVSMDDDEQENGYSPNELMNHNNNGGNVGQNQIEEELDIQIKDEVVRDDEDLLLEAIKQNAAPQRDRSSSAKVARSSNVRHPMKSKPNKKTPKAKLIESQSLEASCSLAVNRFECDQCDYASARRDHLNRHMLKHTGEKPFQCTQCSKRFARKDHLRMHLLIHAGEKKYRCSQCPKRFTTKGHLKTHMTTHRNRCQRCRIPFAQENEKIEHERNCKVRFYECADNISEESRI